MNHKKIVSYISEKNNFKVLVFTIFSLIFIFYCVYLSAFSVLHNDISFNTDLARDFLLLEDVQSTHKIPLIGPRSGGIPGVFHGPLWIYINLPAFVIGHQDPVVVGWFWIMLVIISIGIVYFVGRKIFGHVVGLLAASLVAVNSIIFASSLFNPYGAVIFSPLFLYFFHKYFINYKIKDLLISLFIIGIMIQFQVAFGAPILVLSTILILYLIFKKRKYFHLIAFLILAIPLSTYAIFDLRHSFLEFKSVTAFIVGKTGNMKEFTHLDLIHNRYDGFVNSLIPLQYPSKIIIVIAACMIVYLFYKSLKNKEKYSKFILFFGYFLFGYWLMTFLFKGIIWNYYYWPFMPVASIVIASSYRYVNKYVFSLFFAIIIYSSFVFSSGYITNLGHSFIGNDGGSWRFNYDLANKIFDENDKEFSYYIFSPDQYGYSSRYAMNYIASKNPDIKVTPYSKSKLTYLIIAPPGGKNNSIGGEWWKKNRVKIDNNPEKVIHFKNGFKIEKIKLLNNEILIPSDPNLIDSLIFR